jgi:Mg2+-importing ATPase
VIVLALTLAIPYTPLARILGFVPLPPIFLLLLAAVVAMYVFSAEVAKRIFFRRHRNSW